MTDYVLVRSLDLIPEIVGAGNYRVRIADPDRGGHFTMNVEEVVRAYPEGIYVKASLDDWMMRQFRGTPLVAVVIRSRWELPCVHLVPRSDVSSDGLPSC